MGEASDLAKPNDLNPHRHPVGKQEAAPLLTRRHSQRCRKRRRTGGRFEHLSEAVRPSEPLSRLIRIFAFYFLEGKKSRGSLGRKGPTTWKPEVTARKVKDQANGTYSNSQPSRPRARAAGPIPSKNTRRVHPRDSERPRGKI